MLFSAHVLAQLSHGFIKAGDTALSPEALYFVTQALMSLVFQ